MKKKIIFITNVCAHYTIRLYELLSEKIDIEYYFTGGDESYWDKKHDKLMGNFRGEYLKGFFILPKFKITPGLFRVLFGKFDIMIKTIDDRFALPVTFLFAKIFRRPFIFWVGIWKHPQTFFHRISYVLTKWIYYGSDAIVVYGEHIRRYLVSIGVDEEKIFCAPHAIDNSRFNSEVSDDEKEKIRGELNLSNKKIVLYVGRLEPCKGLEYLIEAMAGISADNAIAVFVGSGSQKESFMDKCRQMDVESCFLEYIANAQLYKYYAIADIFVLPSISTRDFKEPWGFVVNEAMNQGCPIIATDAVGSAAGGLVEDGKNGYIVPEKNMENLKNAINKILSDEALRENMAVYSKGKIRDWTQEKMAQGFIDAIEFVKQKRRVNKNN